MTPFTLDRQFLFRMHTGELTVENPTPVLSGKRLVAWVNVYREGDKVYGDFSFDYNSPERLDLQDPTVAVYALPKIIRVFPDWVVVSMVYISKKAADGAEKLGLSL